MLESLYTHFSCTFVCIAGKEGNRSLSLLIHLQGKKWHFRKKLLMGPLRSGGNVLKVSST